VPGAHGDSLCIAGVEALQAGWGVASLRHVAFLPSSIALSRAKSLPLHRSAVLVPPHHLTLFPNVLSCSPPLLTPTDGLAGEVAWLQSEWRQLLAHPHELRPKLPPSSTHPYVTCILSPLLPSQTDDLASEVARLQSERRQLLAHLQDANEQIVDLHDELGPAIIRGCCSPSRTSRLSSVRAAAAAAANGEDAWQGRAAAGLDLGRQEGEQQQWAHCLVAFACTTSLACGTQLHAAEGC
jgi:hypothetical protein